MSGHGEEGGLKNSDQTSGPDVASPQACSLAVQGTLKSLSLAPQFKSINSSALSFLYGPTLTSVHDYWKNHSLDYTDLCWQNDVSAF